MLVMFEIFKSQSIKINFSLAITIPNIIVLYYYVWKYFKGRVISQFFIIAFITTDFVKNNNINRVEKLLKVTRPLLF